MKAFVCSFLIMTIFASVIYVSFNPVSAADSGSSGIRFGINYDSTLHHYDPNYLSDQELDRDFSLFQRQGIQYVSLQVIWKYFEPKLGEYNESAIEDLKRVCNFAEKYNLEITIDFHTVVNKDSPWTIPEWVAPRYFETVFTNNTVRQAWLNFQEYIAKSLNNVSNIKSWQMMNEPARQSWACNVSIDQYIQLWTDMKQAFKKYSDRTVSIRFATETLGKNIHFNFDPRIYDICDYISLNWYIEIHSIENLTSDLSNARQHNCKVVISEFGANVSSKTPINDESIFTQQYADSVNLFRSLGIEDCAAFFWRADDNSSIPSSPGTGCNLAADVNGTPRPAFYYLDGVPPTITIQSPKNQTYTTTSIPLTFTINEPTSLVQYSLDEAENITLDNNVTLAGLAFGSHKLRLYCSDLYGNTALNTTYFTIRPAIVFSDSFESGKFSAWTGTSRSSGETTSITSTFKYSGVYSAKFSSNGGKGTEYSFIYKTIKSSQEVYSQAFFYVNKSGITNNGNSHFFIGLSTSKTTIGYVGWKEINGTLKWCLQMKNGASNVINYSTSSPTIGQWYNIEFHWKKGISGGLGELMVNDVLVCQLNGINSATYGNVTRVLFGLPQIYNCRSTIVYCDNCIILSV